MPDFDNFRTAVTCQGEPRRVPQFDGTVAADLKDRLMGKPVRSLAEEVEFWMTAGYDYVPYTVGFRQTVRGEKGGIMGAAEYDTDLLQPAQAQYNPFKEEATTRMWANESTGVIHDRATMDDFPWPDPDTAYDYQRIAEIGRLMPSGAQVLVNVGWIFTAASVLMGLENFCVALAEDDPVVTEMTERVGRIQRRVVENVLQFDCVGGVRMPDDLGHTGGLIVSPKYFREHVFPWYQRIGELVHGKGLLYMYHSDGKLYQVLDDLVACGFQSLHPCEPSSMDIDRLKREYAGRLCLCGNINLDSTMTLGTPQEVEEEVKLRIRTIAPGGGYCCGTSNSVPEYVPFENYQAMRAAIRKYGEYPITV